jgi:hypothetical protein
VRVARQVNCSVNLNNWDSRSANHWRSYSASKLRSKLLGNSNLLGESESLLGESSANHWKSMLFGESLKRRLIPTWEQDLLLHATEKPSTISLYELLTQKHTTLLAVSDGGEPKSYGSFGWVLGTDQEILWVCKGIARGYPAQSYRAEGLVALHTFVSCLLFPRWRCTRPLRSTRTVVSSIFQQHSSRQSQVILCYETGSCNARDGSKLADKFCLDIWRQTNIVRNEQTTCFKITPYCFGSAAAGSKVRLKKVYLYL